jgi:catechol 2,3-dioxygenase-like lactoylglutathione lyase family enzyme
VNYFLGVPGKPVPELELTYNFGVSSYELGTAYGHVALTVDDLDATLARLSEQGIEPERPPYTVREGGSRLCFVRDPDRCLQTSSKMPIRRVGCALTELPLAGSLVGSHVSTLPDLI